MLFDNIIFDHMGKKSELTKTRIIETARSMFIEKGFDGLKMQELADQAGVNKGLLHHYFNNKTTLFENIFSDAAKQLFSGIETIIASDGSPEYKFEAVIDGYFDLLINNPRLPVFVLFELQRNPEKLFKIFKPQQIVKIVQAMATQNHQIDQEKATHVVITIVSLCVFPFMAKPIIDQIIQDRTSFENLIEERRPLVKMLIANLLNTL